MRPPSRRARSFPIGPALLALSALVGLAASSCGERTAGGARAVDRGALPTEGRVFVGLDDFLRDYWERPIPLQGAAPAAFSQLEASLQPAVCGGCHPQQYADWGTSIHAAAFSPGLSGQLVNWEGYDYETVRSCLSCHTPLSEQSAQSPDTAGRLVANPDFDASLQQSGLVCAGCHVRGWLRHGPPRRDGSLTASPPGAPHAGATRTPYFEDSRFCASCHQFELPAPNGKSLQNTYTEWEQSRYAKVGVSCQGCHMPDRRHLWRGVHDSTMVRSGVTIEWVSPAGSGATDTVALRVTNSGTGHRFPSYVTPEVIVRIDLLDGQGRRIEAMGAEATIDRQVENRGGVWVEVSDTRLAPDSSLTLTASISGSGARFARGAVIVYPDAFYHRSFTQMLMGQLSDTSRTLITEAQRRAAESSFAIFDDTLRLR